MEEVERCQVPAVGLTRLAVLVEEEGAEPADTDQEVEGRGGVQEGVQEVAGCC